jgi:dimethylsulfone monooxygenase
LAITCKHREINHRTLGICDPPRHRAGGHTLREIIAKAHVEAVHGFRDAVRQAGQSTQDQRGMWADSSFEDLVQYNDGFRTQLIGTPEQVARRIVDYRRLGVDLILTGFLHYHEEVQRFGADVLPIVRELEIENGLDPVAVPDPAAIPAPAGLTPQ